MGPVFIYYSNLIFDQNKRFALEFSNKDLLEGVIFKKKNKDYYISSISCYVNHGTVTEQSQFDEIK